MSSENAVLIAADPRLAPESSTPAPRTGARAAWTARVVLGVSLIVWLLSLHGLAHAPLNQYGLLVADGPGLLVATLGVAISFVLAVRANSVRDCVLVIAAYVAVTRATSSLIADLPIYPWTYKHVGVISHLNQTGDLARNVDIYNNWPGFFSIAGWFSDLTGVSPIDVARWFPIGADAATAVAMMILSRAFGQSTRVALVAGFCMQTFNWVAQDYYSPQAVAFVLALAALALLVRTRHDPRAAWFSVPLFAAITITHQLTPFWLCGIVVLLALTKRIRPRLIAVVYVVLALVFAAVNFKALTPYGLLTGFDPLANAQTNVPTAGNAGRSFTSLAAKGTSALMWLSAIACGFAAKRRREQVWIPAVLAFTSFALLAGQSYGGEAIFRVFLYSIPGCVLLIAPVVERGISDRVRGARHPLFTVVRKLVIAAGIVLAVAGSMQAYYGTWFVNQVDRDALVAAEHFLDTAPVNSLEVPLALGIPERPAGRYADFAAVDQSFDQPLVNTPGILQSSFGPAEMRTITARYQQQNRPVYIFVTRQDRRYANYYGLFPPGAVDRFVAWLDNSTDWTTLADTPTLSIFRLNRP